MSISAKLFLQRKDMNKTEERFSFALDQGVKSGKYLQWFFEDITLRLGDNCRYTPDFAVLLSDMTFRFYEVKGFWRDDARVKIKVAASKYPFFEFRAVVWKKNTWEVEVIKP